MYIYIWNQVEKKNPLIEISLNPVSILTKKEILSKTSLGLKHFNYMGTGYVFPLSRLRTVQMLVRTTLSQECTVHYTIRITLSQDAYSMI